MIFGGKRALLESDSLWTYVLHLVWPLAAVALALAGVAF